MRERDSEQLKVFFSNRLEALYAHLKERLFGAGTSPFYATACRGLWPCHAVLADAQNGSRSGSGNGHGRRVCALPPRF